MVFWEGQPEIGQQGTSSLALTFQEFFKMNTTKTNLARIPVQQSFCSCCAHKIKDALSAIEDISNVCLYPNDALVVFNFVRANEISKALNVLTDLGHPEEGEIVDHNNTTPDCGCRKVFIAQDNGRSIEDKPGKMARSIAQKFPFKPQNSLSPTLIRT